jgi:hypothetical protein
MSYELKLRAMSYHYKLEIKQKLGWADAIPIELSLTDRILIDIIPTVQWKVTEYRRRQLPDRASERDS